jgi:hypothetical protein
LNIPSTIGAPARRDDVIRSSENGRTVPPPATPGARLAIVLAPDGAPVEPAFALHRAIVAVLRRLLASVTCPCEACSLRLTVAETWRVGGFQITRIEGCCPTATESALSRLPNSFRKEVADAHR